MAKTLKDCCIAARDEYVARLVMAVQSYPVIKSIPCPTCRTVIPIRVYGPNKTADAPV